MTNPGTYLLPPHPAPSGPLPSWCRYITLRGYLTIISVLSMLATTAFFLARDFEKAMKRMAEDDERKAVKLAERDAEAAAATAFAAAALAAPSPKKKGLW